MKNMHPNSLRNLRPHDRWRGRIPVPEHTHPIIRSFVKEANAQRATMVEIADRSGVSVRAISSWLHRCEPTIANLDAVFNVLGYEISIRPKEEA